MRSRHLFLIGLTTALAVGPAVASEVAQTAREVVHELPLKQLRGPLTTLYSKGYKEVAELQQAHFAAFVGHYDAVLAQGFRLTVAVLTPEDWAALDGSRPYGTPYVADLGTHPVLVLPVELDDAMVPVAMHEAGHALVSQFLWPSPRPRELTVKWIDEWLAVFVARGYALATGEVSPGNGWTGDGPVPPFRTLADYDAHQDAIEADPSSAQFAWYRRAFEAQVDVVYAKHGLAWLGDLRSQLPWDAYPQWTPNALLQVLAAPDPSWILWARKLEGPPTPVVAEVDATAEVEETTDAETP